MKNILISPVIILTICFLFPALHPSSLTAQEKNSLVIEVLTAYKTHGFDGVKEYVQKNKNGISSDSIIVIARSGKQLRNETVIRIACTMAEVIEDEKAIAWCDYYLADHYSSVKKYDEALIAFNKALPIFIEVEDLKGQAFIYDNLGRLYLETQKLSLAKKSFNNLLQVSQQLENDYMQGWSYQKLGDISFETGDNNTALKMYSNALVFFGNDKDSFSQASTYFGMGTVYTEVNEFQKAIDTFSKSAEFFKVVNNNLGQASAYDAMGYLYGYLNNYQKALKMFSKALPYFEKTEDNSSQGNIFYNFGNIYLEIGDTTKAKNGFAKALTFYEKADDPKGIGNSYQGLASVCRNSNDIREAISLQLKAAVYYKRALYRYGLSNLFLQVGESFNKLGQFQESLDTYSRALPIFEMGKDLLGQAKVNLEFGKVYMKMGDIKKANEMYSTATPLLEKVNAAGLKADLLLAKANLFSKINDRNKAFQQYDSALTILEKIRTETGFAEMKMTYVEKVGQSIEDAILFMINNNYPESAFKYLESIKARTLLDQLTEKNVGHVDKGLSPELKQTRDKLMASLSFTKSSLTKAINEQDISKLQKQQNNLEQEWDKLSQQIRFQNPAYAAILYPQTISIKELQTKILKPEEAMLNYFVGANDTYVIVITSDSLKIIKLPNGTAFIENEVSNYLRNLRNNRQVYESSLYQLLIEPAVEYVKGKNVLLIAPDGFLTTIPFESIITGNDESSGKTKYLIENYTIKYVQSATMLSLLRTTLKQTNTSDRFIGFGDPVYDYQNFIAGKPERGEREKEKSESYTASLKGNSYDLSGGTMNRLEGSGEEVREISKLFGENKSTIFTREDAKEENIKKTDLKDYGYIVLSCHGLASDEFQSLVLSQIPNAEEDGYLTLDEIMNLDWNARLVVLSACQTGKGKIRRGEGVIGLTRAVMHAGTDAAVVSLWNVSDEGTKELMIKLFQNILQKNLTKEEALRMAKLEMLNSNFSNPYFWSAFVMYGE